MERTLVILKPDAVEQALVSQIMLEIGRLGLVITALRRTILTAEQARAHYPEHADKPYFPRISAYMTRGNCVIMICEGDDAVRKVRDLAGATRPDKADPRSLRGRYGRMTADGGMENVIHASATPEEASLEITRFFP